VDHLIPYYRTACETLLTLIYSVGLPYEFYKTIKDRYPHATLINC